MDTQKNIIIKKTLEEFFPAQCALIGEDQFDNLMLGNSTQIIAKGVYKIDLSSIIIILRTMKDLYSLIYDSIKQKLGGKAEQARVPPVIVTKTEYNISNETNLTVIINNHYHFKVNVPNDVKVDINQEIVEDYYKFMQEEIESSKND